MDYLPGIQVGKLCPNNNALRELNSASKLDLHGLAGSDGAEQIDFASHELPSFKPGWRAKGVSSASWKCGDKAGITPIMGRF